MKKIMLIVSVVGAMALTSCKTYKQDFYTSVQTELVYGMMLNDISQKHPEVFGETFGKYHGLLNQIHSERVHSDTIQNMTWEEMSNL